MPNWWENERDRIIKEHGGVLVRWKKHQVYRFPDGRIFTHASSPGDVNSDKNNLTDLKKMLGIKEEKTVRTEPRKKKQKTERISKIAQFDTSLKIPDFRDSLRNIRMTFTPTLDPKPPCAFKVFYQSPLETILQKLLR